MSFDLAFRAHVIPRLSGMIDAEAFFLALGTADFEASLATIMDEAIRLGAMSLSDQRFNELTDWLSSKLLTAALDAENRIAAIRTEATADPASFYAKAATPSTRWTFAAICPKYRKRLIEETRRGR